MPTAEFLTQVNRKEVPPIQHYGFDRRFFLDFSDVISSLVADEDFDQSSERIKSKILRAGACPSDMRTYYTFSSNRPKYGTRENLVSNFFDEGDISRGDAGLNFERWIATACECVNEWLETGDDHALHEADIPGSIREYFVSQLPQIEKLADDLSIPLESLTMNVEPGVQADPFTREEPDGTWIMDNVAEYPGGVFESKLSIPYEPAIRMELAGYAVHLERKEGQPVEFGVVQFLDEENMEIKIRSYHIDNSLRQNVRENIQRFTQLISNSKLTKSWDDGDTLREKLVEPDTPDYSAPCTNCGYEWYCQGQKHIDALRSLETSIKLGPNRLISVLEAVFEGEPNRRDVERKVVEEFDGKSAKSVFRGMTQPTLETLRLARNDAKRGTFFLSPDGKMIIGDSSKHQERIACYLRDFAVHDLGLYSEAVDFLSKFENELIDEFPKFKERINRFRKDYLEAFDVGLPELSRNPDLSINRVYSGNSVHKYLIDEEERAALLRESLAQNQKEQMEQARWKIMRTLLVNDHTISSLFVDELIWREWRSHQPVIDLWEGSSGHTTQLIRQGTPYDNVILKGDR